jgi:hypothetical protein
MAMTIGKWLTTSLSLYVLLMLTGCASGMSTAVKTPQRDLTKDRQKAYIVFSRPALVGMALSNTIIEFDPVTKRTKPVGTLAAETRILYETTPGTHYFYMDGGENDDMIKMTVESGRVYYVETRIGMGVVAGRFYFKPLRYTDYRVIGSLKGEKCDGNLLTRYGFTPVENEASSFAAADEFHSDRLKTTISCSGGVVKRLHTEYDLDDLKGAKLVAPNEKAIAYYEKQLQNYLKEIEEDFADWAKEDMSKTEVGPEDGFPLTI